MMVITAMATGVVLSTAYVASRSNASVIGSNLAASSQARVNVESSLALTTAALTMDADWREKHVDGLLLERTDGNTSTRVELIDLATGSVPDRSTVDIRAVVSTSVEGIERTAEADFFIALPEQAGSIDIDLGEFAMFAGDSVTVRSEAVVEAWSASPASGRGDPIRVATANGTSGAVQVQGAAAVVHGVEYASEVRAGDSGPLPVSHIPDRVVMPMPAPPRDLQGAPFLAGAQGRIETDARMNELTMSGGMILELTGGADLLVEGDLVLTGGSTLRISGDSHLVVTGDANITDSTIEVAETGSLSMHVGGDLDFRHAEVVEPGGTVDTWVPDLDRVKFLSLAARETIPRWRVRGRSLVKGEFYAPTVEFQLQGRAVLVGRIAAQRVLLEGRSCLLYDPALDDRNGYTAIDERAFDETGELLGPIAELEDLSTESLAELSEELDVPVAAGEEYVEPVEEVEDCDASGGARRWNRHRAWRGHRWWNEHRANHIQRQASWSFRIRHIGRGF